MARVGAQRAAVLTGKSKSTIQRAMNSGKLSYQLDQNNRRVIDVSELERVFGIKQQSLNENTVEAPRDVDNAVEKERMSMTIKMLEMQLQDARDQIDDLKEQRDKWEKQASQVLITSQYTQKQAEDLKAQIKEREERARKRRLQNAQLQKAQSNGKADSSNLGQKMKGFKAQNENDTETPSVFQFWKRARG